MAVTIAHLPPFRRAGRALLVCRRRLRARDHRLRPVDDVLASLLMLFLLGALDIISVVIRATLILHAHAGRDAGAHVAVNSISSAHRTNWAALSPARRRRVGPGDLRVAAASGTAAGGGRRGEAMAGDGATSSGLDAP